MCSIENKVKELAGMMYIVVSTKGGVGKSTIATQVVAPLVYDITNEPVKVLEVDNNNVSDTLDSAIVKVSSFTVADGIFETQKSLFEVFNNKQVVIDGGGGDDTNKLIESVTNLNIDDKCTFFIPVLKNKNGMKNLIDTYRKIRENSSSKIVVVLNQANSSIAKDLEKEFCYFFGNEKLSITGAFSEMYEDANIEVVSVQDTNVFDLAEDYQLTAYEIALENIDTGSYLAEKNKEGYDAFMKAMTFCEIYNFCVSYKKHSLDKFIEQTTKFISE